MKTANNIVQASNQCVKCGLCSTVCPTYQLTHDEAESARGRIALMQGLVQGQLSLTTTAQTHLESCLSCGLCETVCPAQVDYSDLIDSTKLWLRENNRPASRLSQALCWLIQKPWRLRVLHHLLYRLQQLGLLRWLKKMPATLQRTPSYLPALLPPKTWQTHYPSSHTHHKRHVGLFQGCLQSMLDQATLTDSILLLNRLGFDVHIPKKSVCCGALALHSGHPEKITPCHPAFNALSLDAVITTTPGCSAVMKPADFHAPLIDIHPFLAAADWSSVRFRTSSLTLALHVPCTQNRQFSATMIQQLLQKIPGISVVPFESGKTCCGAAGTYMLDHPEMADGLCAKLLEKLPEKTDILLSSNLGCLLHLQRFLQTNKSKIKVQHPISLLAQYVI